MPELPEVETVRSYLQDNIINFKINDVKLSSKKSLRNVSEKNLSKLIGQKIIGTNRKAKHLVIKLEKDYLILHLRMEGKIFIFKNVEEMKSSTKRLHDIITFYTNKGIILFQDTRRFATVDMFSNNIELTDNPILSKVGPEPFDLDYKVLYDRLSNKRVKIKTALLDQTIISGLGNIYVDEVLHSCGIHPETISNKVPLEKCKGIVDESKRILKKAIKLKGTSIRTYTSQYGVKGLYQDHLNVHQQSNCRVCGNSIIKIKVGGRGTYYCKKCQK